MAQLQEQQQEQQPVSLLSYPGWQDDKEAAERIYMDHSIREDHLFQEKIGAMKTKQRLFDGDRSDPSVCQLDAAEFTYKGCDADKQEAERRLSGDCSVLQLGSYSAFYNKMIKKQAVTSDRSGIPCLRELDGTPLTYSGCELDKAAAERFFTEYQTPVRFYEKLTAMKNKQRLHQGDRSHPEIFSLDTALFTYENWHADRQEYLNRHTGDCSLFQLGITCDFLLAKMLKKQQIHDHRSSISLLQALDSFDFSYDGWQVDKRQAEGYYADFSSPGRFQDKLQAMKNKQQLLVDKDRSHPDVVALDIIHLSYSAWEADKEQAEKQHIGNCTVLQLGGFALALKKMKKRQAQHVQQYQTTTPSGLGNVGCLLPALSEGSGRQPLCLPATTTTTVFFGCDNNPADEAPLSYDDNKMCVVCLEQEPRYAFIPCGHLCVCSGCVPLLEGREGALQCPLCRKKALVLTRIFA